MLRIFTYGRRIIPETPLRGADELRACCGDGTKRAGKGSFSRMGFSGTESGDCIEEGSMSVGMEYATERFWGA